MSNNMKDKIITIFVTSSLWLSVITFWATALSLISITIWNSFAVEEMCWIDRKISFVLMIGITFFLGTLLLFTYIINKTFEKE